MNDSYLQLLHALYSAVQISAKAKLSGPSFHCCTAECTSLELVSNELCLEKNLVESTSNSDAVNPSQIRILILNAAAKLFLENGFEQTSMDLVAQEAGVGRRTVYNQFKSKKALFDETISRIWTGMPIGRISSEAESDRNPAIGLRKIGMAIADFWTPQEAVSLLRMVIGESKQFPDLAKSFVDQGKLPALQAVVSYLNQLNQTGQVKIQDTDLAARQFVGMINEPLLWYRVIGVGRPPTKQRKTVVVERAVHMFLAGSAP